MPRDTAESLHLQIEAIKLAFADARRYIGDPRHPTGPDESLWPRLLAKEYAASRRSLVGDTASVPAAGDPLKGGTVYLCAADGDGMMVSLIESNYMGFGSGVMGGSTGIMLQNRGAYFSLDPAHPNALAPRARTLHTLMPGMLLRDGRAEVAFGAMGGDGQPQTMVQLADAVVDERLDPHAAVTRARFVALTEAAGAPLGPIQVERHEGAERTAAELRRWGHEVEVIDPLSAVMGWAQVIRREPDGSYTGGADPRADSLAAGF